LRDSPWSCFTIYIRSDSTGLWETPFMDFALSEEQRDFRMAMLWPDHIAPFSPGSGRKTKRFPKNLWPKMAELALAGFYVVRGRRRSSGLPGGRDAGVRGD